MSERAPSTQALLACGVVAGPLYVVVTLVESLTRDGFDLRHDRFSWLTAGDLGWIHQVAMIGVGALSVLLAVGAGRRMREGRGAVWGPRLLALFGAAYVAGGLLRADAVVGFPPGTTAEMVHQSWHGIAQNASRSASSLFLVGASLVFASAFAAQGRRGWACFYATALPAAFAALTGVGLAIGGNPVALAFLMTPWVWVTALALNLYGRERVTASPA
ncbi:MAG TPA: DUF998 domain-containing protein [Myxococcota bacterium]|nr:DUF998 domain-containing protein [Myxococcota bacterium]